MFYAYYYARVCTILLLPKLYRVFIGRTVIGRAERRAKQKIKQPTYLHQEKRWKAHIREMVPKIYAAFCLVLNEKYGLTFEQIVDILAATQDLWQSDGENGFDILNACVEKTGINLMR